MPEVPYKFVEIEWLDANSSNSWDKKEELPKAARAVTRGWLSNQTLDELVVSATYSPSDSHSEKEEFNQSIAIPMGMVISLTELAV